MNENHKEKPVSTGKMFQFSMVKGVTEMIAVLFGSYLNFYYVNVVLLPELYFAVAWAIFTVWDAFNDPYVGYLADKPRKFWAKYGKRAPWIIIGENIPAIITAFIAFIPIGGTPLMIMISLTIILIVHEFCYTMVSNNQWASIPEKFPDIVQRNKFSGIFQLVAGLAIFAGIMLPTFFIGETPTQQDYYMGIGVACVVSVLLFVFGIPGVKESQAQKERNLKNVTHVPFFKVMKQAVKQRNFMISTIVGVLVTAYNTMYQASIWYWLGFVVEDAPPGADSMLVPIWFVAMLISLIGWKLVTDKVGAKWSYFYGVLISFVACILIVFIESFPGALVATAFLGLGFGAVAFCTSLMFADVCDEYKFIHKQGHESTLAGIVSFFNRGGLLIQVGLFWLVHILTDYTPGLPGEVTQSPLSKIGITALISWIPGILLLIGAFLQWKFYDLDLEKTTKIKAALEESNL